MSKTTYLQRQINVAKENLKSAQALKRQDGKDLAQHKRDRREARGLRRHTKSVVIKETLTELIDDLTEQIDAMKEELPKYDREIAKYQQEVTDIKDIQRSIH